MKPHEHATSDRDPIVYHIPFSTLDDSPHWIDLPKRNGDETFELPIPATYSVETDRKIRKALVDGDKRAQAGLQICDRMKSEELPSGFCNVVQ